MIRRTAIRKVRSKARPGRLKGAKLEDLRRACFERDGSKCTDCGRPVLWESGSWYSGQMAHIKAKRRHGDSLENVRTLCMECHMREHNPKSVPPKERVA